MDEVQELFQNAINVALKIKRSKHIETDTKIRYLELLLDEIDTMVEDLQETLDDED